MFGVSRYNPTLSPLDLLVGGWQSTTIGLDPPLVLLARVATSGGVDRALEKARVNVTQILKAKPRQSRSCEKGNKYPLAGPAIVAVIINSVDLLLLPLISRHHQAPQPRHSAAFTTTHGGQKPTTGSVFVVE